MQKHLIMIKNKIIFLIALTIGVFATSCKQNTVIEHVSTNEKLIFATLFVQQSAEFKALSYQAYNIGRLQLDKAITENKGKKKLAIVLDIDETVLDNSPFEAKCILENTNYPTNWIEWCKEEKAESIAGALDFINYASQNGVEVFYISNRKMEVFEATRTNLIKNGFPFADSTHMLLRTSVNDKEQRRALVSENFEIVLLFGDNLGDFTNLFDDKSTADRYTLVEEMKAEFGSRYIVLPNPMYGAWDAAMMHGLDIINKDSVYLARLKSF